MDSLHEQQHHLADLIPLLKEKNAQGESLCIGPKGTSMMPLIRQGIDFVELSAVPEKLKKYDLPLYQRKSGQFVLHRIVKAGDTYTCVGDNQFELEKGLRHEQVIALATAIYRGDKRVSVDSFGYKLYCRFWHYTRPIRCIYRKCRAGLGKLVRKFKKQS